MQIDQSFLLDVLQALIRADSTNPSLSPTGAGEQEVVQTAVHYCSALGLDIAIHEQTPGRPSLVATLPGRGNGRSLLLNAHLDTVGVDGMSEPFSGRHDADSGRVYGRGAVDMKGSMAAQIAAVKAIQDAGISLGGDLHIAGVADEEFASLGVQEIIPHYPVDGVIVTEPSDLNISVAHKGFIWLEVKTFGRAYHGSRPDLGIDANMHMGHFLSELSRLEAALRQRPPHPLLGPPSLHAATLQGGSEWSAYAAECTLGIERRTIPGETAAQVEQEITAILKMLHETIPHFNATVEVKLVREPFEVDPQAPIVQALQSASAAVLPTPPPVIGQLFWTDAAFHAASGVETVLIGPVGHGLHAAEEWVDFNSVVQLAEILARTAVDFCHAYPA